MLENDIRTCLDRLETLENQIQKMENVLKQKESHITQKKNILERVEALEKINVEKDVTINILSSRIEKLEQSLNKAFENEKEEAMSHILVPCEYCDFEAKNERGLKLHVKAKHEITKVELKVFCKATEKYLSSDRDSYRKELESEIDVLEDVIEMDLDSSKIYDYVGKFLPTKIILRTRFPAQWQDNENFRKQVWEKINKRIPKGKISEDKDGKD